MEELEEFVDSDLWQYTIPTLDEFVRALREFDIDGNGINRVEKAANKTLEKCREEDNVYLDSECLQRCYSSSCLLAHSWGGRNEDVFVERDSVIFGDQIEKPHAYKSVVWWFDDFGSDEEASTAVLSFIKKAREKGLIS